MPATEIRIPSRHLELVRAILRRYVPDRDVWAFGSRVAGRVKPYSDLDLAITGEGPVPISAMAALNSDLEESTLPFKVDLLDLTQVSPAFRERIERTRVLVQAAAPRPAQAS